MHRILGETTLTLPDGTTESSLARIVANNHEIRYDSSLPANKWFDGKTCTLAGGGKLLPKNGTRLRNGDPYGTRTRVTAVKGRCPRPLDEGV